MNIVWIEENPWAIEVTAENLARHYGYNIQIVGWNDGVPAIETLLREVQPDLLIIHPGSIIPRGEAAEVAKLAKGLGAKIILVGASAVLFEMADGFTGKPFTLSHIAKKIAAVMEPK